MADDTGTPKAIALRMLDTLQHGKQVAWDIVEVAENLVSEGKYQELIDLHNSVRSIRALNEIGVSRAYLRNIRFSGAVQHDDIRD